MCSGEELLSTAESDTCCQTCTGTLNLISRCENTRVWGRQPEVYLDNIGVCSPRCHVTLGTSSFSPRKSTAVRYVCPNNSTHCPELTFPSSSRVYMWPLRSDSCSAGLSAVCLCRWQARSAMLLWACTRLCRRRTAGGKWPGSGTTVGKWVHTNVTSYSESTKYAVIRAFEQHISPSVVENRNNRTTFFKTSCCSIYMCEQVHQSVYGVTTEPRRWLSRAPMWLICWSCRLWPWASACPLTWSRTRGSPRWGKHAILKVSVLFLWAPLWLVVHEFMWEEILGMFSAALCEQLWGTKPTPPVSGRWRPAPTPFWPSWARRRWWTMSLGVWSCSEGSRPHSG